MQRRLLLLQMMALLFVFANSHAQDFQTNSSLPAKQARILATQQLPAVLQWMEPEDLALYGFSATDDFSKITVGRPFYLSSMDDVTRMKQAGRSNLQINSMMLPLILDNSVRCFIYLSYEEGKWKAVGLGSREYAIRGGSLFNKADDNASLMIAALQLSEEFIVDNATGVSRYLPVLHVNKELSKASYSINELTKLHTDAVQKVK